MNRLQDPFPATRPASGNASVACELSMMPPPPRSSSRHSVPVRLIMVDALELAVSAFAGAEATGFLSGHATINNASPQIIQACRISPSIALKLPSPHSCVPATPYRAKLRAAFRSAPAGPLRESHKPYAARYCSSSPGKSRPAASRGHSSRLHQSMPAAMSFPIRGRAPVSQRRPKLRRSPRTRDGPIPGSMRPSLERLDAARPSLQQVARTADAAGPIPRSSEPRSRTSRFGSRYLPDKSQRPATSPRRASHRSRPGLVHVPCSRNSAFSATPRPFSANSAMKFFFD